MSAVVQLAGTTHSDFGAAICAVFIGINEPSGEIKVEASPAHILARVSARAT